MSTYSQFFDVVHDEQDPVGFLGRGTHCSVFEYPAWVTLSGDFVRPPLRHRFAVVWDEDHDDRVVTVLDQLYRHGLLSSILIAGERKGMMTVIVSEQTPPTELGLLKAKCEEASSLTGDWWPAEIVPYGQDCCLINDRAEAVNFYLGNLRSQWRLGLSQYPEPISVQT